MKLYVNKLKKWNYYVSIRKFNNNMYIKKKK